MINEIRPMNHLTSLQNFICTIGNLPTSYALSLSYEEQIWWLCDFLEKKVFPAIEENTVITEETQKDFLELKQYVNDYFENLDVQEEINNKLDEMAENGTLSRLIEIYVNNDIMPLISNIQNLVSSLSSGTPIFVESIAEMTDTTKTYVNLTDGYLYYYNGTSWEQAFLYQSSGIANGSIFTNKLSSDLQKSFKNIVEKITPTNLVTGFYTTSGTVNSDQNYCHTQQIEVNPNEQYFIPSPSVGAGTIASVVFFDSNHTFVNAITTKNQFITIPDNVKYMSINYLAKTAPYVEKVYYKVISQKINGQGLLNYGDMDEAFRNSFIPIYENIDVTFSQGFYIIANPGAISEHLAESSNFEHTSIIVNPGETFKIIGDVVGNVALYQFLNGENSVSFPSSSIGSRTHYEKEITIPENCNVLYVSGYKNTISIQKILGYTFSNVSNNNYEIEQLKKFNINEQLKNDFKWKDFESSRYATFTFDDTNADISTILALFKNKNVPVCFATIPSKLNNICNDGRTAQAVLEDCVNHGGEVLAHWGTPLTSSSSDADYKNVYEGAKKTLQNAGFEVNGIITAGGTNYQTQDFEKDIELARNNYFYADLTATGFTNIEQYYNRRKFLDNGFNDVKSYIDNYLQGNKGQFSNWMNFASHGTNTNTIEEFEQIIDYCLANNIQIVTWKTIYDLFRSSQLEERIKELESN